MRLTLGWIAALVVLAGCRPSAVHAARADAGTTIAMAAPIEAGAVAPEDAAAAVAVAPPGPATIEHVGVPRDGAATFVRSGDGGTTVRALFLAGVCSNAAAYVGTFPEAARAHGGVLAIEGDKPCGAANSGFRSFTWSGAVQRTRLDAALAAAALVAPPDGFTLVGYSAGASIAEMMHAKWPELFPRLVLIAPPDDPKIDYLLHARRVVSMSCSFDVPARMKTAAKRLNAKGVPSIYLEMPKCTHGNIAEGERVFGEAFDFLDGKSPSD